ncbi:MAG TPA: aldehyde dehydrogenase family protein [Verrucomicrobiae bacterium]|jgi:acyl-CoA reductase-like NAD-dependent aldehyde dehydrogenase/nicotinamidase-related amidase|nr:aldehyde dehydrogenase family protein [Verrucomicrobiae bacterium]
MKPVILLIDLQNDFIRSPSLEPAAGQIVAGATQLLAAARAHRVPVVHIWTTVDRQNDQRMPHWKQSDRWVCEAGTPGHETPAALRPQAREPVVHKTFFSAFSTGELESILSSLKADTLVLAGVHLHGCVRSTALDAYQRGFAVWIAEDAIGSDDPLHASVSARWLAARAARFVSVERCIASFAPPVHASLKPPESDTARLPVAIIKGEAIAGGELTCLTHISPREEGKNLWRVPVANPKQISQATLAAREAGLKWRDTPISARAEILLRFAKALDANRDALAQQMAVEIGKPITQGRAEVARSIALVTAVASRAAEPLDAKCAEISTRRNRPLGVVAMITPWNNPVAIPLGKIAPVLLYGNAVVWKPAPVGSAIAVKLMELLHATGCASGLVNLICGDRSSALALMADSAVNAVTITGSPAAGYSAQDICGRRHLPLQAELGGNNAAIVWPDCDFVKAAAEIAEAAFGFAGQRCTANRRVIVQGGIYGPFLEALQQATAKIPWGDPYEPQTRIGPLISSEKCREIATLLERSRAAGARILTPHKTAPTGAYFPPTIVCCDDPEQEIFQEETFGPVVVVTKADDWGHAVRLCNGVRQGLVAALFSNSNELQEKFLGTAQAGILKINLATADADAEAPFGGWKSSGIGPAEHGSSNREFYTRAQAVYRSTA